MPYTAVATTTAAHAPTSSQTIPPPSDIQIPQSSSVASRLSAFSKRQHRYKRLGKYYLGQTIGEGEFGKVKLAWAEDENSQKKQYAIKLLRQDKLLGIDESQKIKVYHEINALQACRHPHIIRLENVLRNEHYIGIILAYASGGDMFSQIYKHGRLDERSAQKLFAQLISGVHYLHQKGIVHRDLKLENLLLDSNQNILISDFGFANSFRTRNGYKLMKTSCGSPCYAAPEVVNSSHNYDGRKVDIWSIGVILFTFLAGYLPFDDDPQNPDSEDIQKLYRYIATTPVKFPEWIGTEARDLLRSILVVDPEKRAKMQDIMAHRWLANHRTFLSITPAEHEGSAPWQRKPDNSHSRASAALHDTSNKVNSLHPAMQRMSAGSAMSPNMSGSRDSPNLSAYSRNQIFEQQSRRNGISVQVGNQAQFPASAAVKRQSASPTAGSTSQIYGYNYSNSATKFEETHSNTNTNTTGQTHSLSSENPKQRLVQPSKPRPISFQVQSPTAFELVDGSSLYMPRASQPRVEISRESSKSGEISRPADIDHRSIPHSASGLPFNPHSQRKSYAVDRGVDSQIPRSISLQMSKTPDINRSSTSVFETIDTPQRSEVTPPTRRTSTVMSNNNVYRQSSSAAERPPSSSTSRIKSRLSSALWPRNASSSSQNSDSGDQGHTKTRSRFEDQHHMQQNTPRTPVLDQNQNPNQSQSQQRVSSFSQYTAPKQQQQQPQQQQQQQQQQHQQQHSKGSETDLTSATKERSHQSGIPVKSNKDSGFKRKTLNFFKRRSMA